VHGAVLGVLLVWTFTMAATVATPRRASAQLVSRAPGAQLGFGYTGVRRSLENEDPLWDNGLRQWLRIPLRGQIVDPRIFNYRLSLDLRWNQQSAATLPDRLKGRSLGWTFDTRAFSNQPLSVGFSARKASGSTGGGANATSEFLATSYTADARFRNAYLPVTVIHSWGRQSRAWATGPDLALHEQTLTRSTQVRAMNRKLAIFYSRFASGNGSVDSRIDGSEARLDHRLEWGKGSQLETTLERVRQEGLLELDRRRWTEELRLQHTERVRSRWSMRRVSSTSRGQQAERRSLNGELEARPAEWLTLGVNGHRFRAEVAGGMEDVTAFGPRASLALWLPARVRLNATGGVRRERRERDTERGFVGVVDEPHVVDAARGFLLDEARIDPSSIFIRSEQLFAYVNGLDYALVPLGDAMQVLIPTGSRIEVGERLFVSYRYQLPDLPNERSVQGNYSVTLSRRGVSLSHAVTFKDGSSDGGAAVRLGGFTERRTALRASLFTPVGRLRTDATLRARDGDDITYEQLSLSFSWTLPPWGRRTVTLGGSLTSSDTNTLRSTTSSLRADLSWPLGRSTRLWLRGERLEFRLPGQPVDRSYGLDADFQAQVGQTVFSLRLNQSFRTGARSVDRGRIFAQVIRRF